MTGVPTARAQCVGNVCNIAAGADCVINGDQLRAAIDTLVTAGTGGTINLSPGTYCFDRPWRLDGIGNEAFTGTKTIAGVEIEIRTTGAPLSAIIQRQPAGVLPPGVSSNYRLFNVENLGGLSLQGLILQNGFSGQGGAIRSVNADRLRLIDCEVRDNSAFTRGGGLFVQATGSAVVVGTAVELGLELRRTTFYRNTALNGFGGGASVEQTDAEVEQCQFSCNRALDEPTDGPDDADGGGLYFNNGGDPGSPTKLLFVTSPTSVRTTFSCNFAASEGGGVFVNGGASKFAGPTFPIGSRSAPFDADFFGNQALFQGGGLYTQATSVEFQGCQFGGLSLTPNCATTGALCTTLGQPNQAMRGGGVMNVTSQALFKRCKFIGNRAVATNGGRAGGAGSSGGTNAYIECCFINNIAASDFAGNLPANSRGGGSDAEFGSPMYNDCLFKGNEAANGGGISISGQGKDTLTLIYNCQITQNVGSVNGGGLAVLGDASPRVLHTTIARNRSSRVGVTPPATPTAGTGIFTLTGLSLPTVINSIITQNQRGNASVNGSFSGAGTVRASFSFIDVGLGAAYPDSVPGGTAGSNIKGCWKLGTNGANFDDNDPSFESSGIEGMNVHLQCNSPCIDHANYALARTAIQFLIALGPNSPVPEARCSGTAAPEARFLCQNGEEAPITNISDPVEVAAFITRFLKDYDDTAATSGNDENCLGLGTGQDRPNTCRPLQCQSDMGADEARTDIQFSAVLDDKVVCINGRQSFTASALCNPPSTPAIPILFTWCRVDRVTCVETPLFSGGAYTITVSPDGTTSTLTINAAAAIDNAYFKVKIARGQYFCTAGPTLLGIPTVPLAPFLSCDDSTCPLAEAQARLYVVNSPTAATTGDKTVCSNGRQCLEYTFGWDVLPNTPQPITCPLGNTLPGRIPPVACNPVITYTYQAVPTGANSNPVPFTGNARAVITCDPDVFGPPDANGVRRATRNCRISFTNPRDTTVPNCDSGRYCAFIDCGLAEGKCLPANACANLCVTPPPTAGGDLNQCVCIGGNQTINLFAEFPLPAACATPWCPSPACIPVVTLFKRTNLGTPPILTDTALTIGQTGRIAVTCDPLNPSTRRINCRIVITGALSGDCAQYCISARCNNLSDSAPCIGLPNVDKCIEPAYCANLCVLDPAITGGDAQKYVCRGGAQTLNFFATFPVPPTAGDCGARCATGCICTPSFTISRRRPGETNFTTLPQGTPCRSDSVGGQTTSQTCVVCTPRPAAPRTFDCVVTITNANDANCGEYKIDANCSNLTAADKCFSTYTGRLCVLVPPSVSRLETGTTKFVCAADSTGSGGLQTFTYRAFYPATPCFTATNSNCPTQTCAPADPFLSDAITFEKRRPAPGATSVVTKYASLATVPAGENRFVVCQPPVNVVVGGQVTGRNIDCTLTIRNATLDDCAQYCLIANCERPADVPIADFRLKCGPVDVCYNLCVLTPPNIPIPPDKSVCIGRPQTLTFQVNFPNSNTLCTYCAADACTPLVTLQRDVLGNGVYGPIVNDGTRLVAACQPFDAVNRRVNCTVTITSALASDCGNYKVIATCGGLSAGKCNNYERTARLCILPNPTVTVEPGTKTVCTGGDQTINYSATFPLPTCIVCPVETCTTPSFEFVRRASCNDTTGGTIIPILTAPPVDPNIRVWVTCSPFNATTRVQDCVVRIRNARLEECGGYIMRATSCAEIVGINKCGYVEACKPVCVVPAPDATGDPTQCVCVGANQTINLRAFFGNPLCTATGVCPTNPAPCTPRYTIVRVFPVNPSHPAGGTETIFDSSLGTQPTIARVVTTCTPVTVAGGRQFNCTVRVTGAQPADCANYCIRATCGNLADGKCSTDEYCAGLCVRPPPTAGGDSTTDMPKYVCQGGEQCINLFADFSPGDCIYCTGPDCCVPTVSVRFRPITGSDTNLPNNAQVGNVRAVCEPINAAGRVNCRVCITNATDANCGSYCIRASCGSALTDAGKCGISDYCAPLCVLRPPTASVVDGPYCVCLGGCQEIRFRVRTFNPNCNLPNCVRASCDPEIEIYKVLSATTRCTYTRVPAGQTPGTNQYVCDLPDNNGDINCRLKIGGGGPCPGAAALGGALGCPGATAEDAGRYCIDVTCAGIGAAKCGRATACTDLTVYEPPCPSEICDQKVCAGQNLCLPFTFSVPACCTPEITILRNGTPITVGNSSTSRIYLEGTGGSRRLCFQNLADADDGRYEVRIRCNIRNNTAADDAKNCVCSECFCLDVLTIPDACVVPRTTSVCVGSEVNIDIFVRSDFMNCGVGTQICPPPLAGSNCPTFNCVVPAGRTSFPFAAGSPMRVPVTYQIRKLSGTTVVLPPNDANCSIEPSVPANFTLTLESGGEPCAPETAGDSRTAIRFRLNIAELAREQCGIYRLDLQYCGINPLGACSDCVYFEIDCQGRLCLKDKERCPGEVVYFCPRLVNTPECIPDPYLMFPDGCESDPDGLPGSCYASERERICCNPAFACFNFQWQKAATIAGPYTDISLGENPTARNCCLDLGVADPSDVGCYRLIATTTTTPANPPICTPPINPPVDCSNREVCILMAEACFRLKPPEECCDCEDCCWNNGPRDLTDGNGVLSMKPALNEFPELRAAADFYLCESEYHKINQFTGSMLIRQNPALPYKACLTLYEDCDGCPGDVIQRWTSDSNDEICYPFPTDPLTGLRAVDFSFDFSEDKLWVRGGRSYWWSLQGISDFNTPNYEAYWVTSDRPVMGSVPKKFEVGVDDEWGSLQECCIGCVELAYCIECEPCKIIWDNGIPELCINAGGSRSEKSTSTARNSRAADNFVTPIAGRPAGIIPPLGEGCFIPIDWMVCYVEGYVYTNCVPGNFSAWLEIYRNDCNKPDYLLAGNPLYRFRADRIDPVVPECIATIDGVSNLRLYKVRFCPVGDATYPNGLFLRGGGTYWLSLSVGDGFSQNQRAYFAWNSDDCEDCPIKISPGREIAPGRNIVRWTETGHDFAFLIAAKSVPFDSDDRAPVVTAQSCPADIDRNGSVTVQDMFDFLAAWFADCP